MSPSADHDPWHEQLPAAALGILDETDLEEVLRHVSGCSACAEALEAYKQVTAELVRLYPAQARDPARPAALRAKLLAKAGRQSPRSASPAPTPAAVRGRPGAFFAERWSGWGVAAVLAGVLLMHHAVHRPLNYGWLVAGGLLLMVVALTLYGGMQRRRVAALEHQLAARDGVPPPASPS